MVEIGRNSPVVDLGELPSPQGRTLEGIIRSDRLGTHELELQLQGSLEGGIQYSEAVGIRSGETFRFENLREGNYTLVALVNRVFHRIQTLSIEPGEGAMNLGTLEMEPRGVIIGKLPELEAGDLVLLRPSDAADAGEGLSRQMQIPESGIFAFSDLPPGNYGLYRLRQNAEDEVHLLDVTVPPTGGQVQVGEALGFM
jgi:hypothetical protein